MMQHLDSLGSSYSDTLIRDKTDSSRSLAKPDLKRKIRIEKTGKELQAELIWNWKVLKHPQQMEYTSDSIWNELSTEKLPFGLRIKLPVTKPGKIRIRMDSIVFYNRIAVRKDSFILNQPDLEDFGSIRGSIENATAGMITELISLEKEVAGKVSGNIFNWKVKPGKYRIQVFLDLNKDRQYTGGNMLSGRKAEPLYHFPEVIELKPGWDLEKIIVKPVF
jgi:hypothetical protein